jgi:hypothetical protein
VGADFREHTAHASLNYLFKSRLVLTRARDNVIQQPVTA